MSINLLRNRGGGGTQTGMTEQFDDLEFGDGGSGGSGGGSQVDSVKKLFLMALAVLCLMCYEWYNISELDDQLAKLKVRNSALALDKKKLSPEYEKSKSLKSENDELKQKIKIIKKLGKSRLREIKAIDHLQSVTPELVWLTSFEFKDDAFSVQGFASNDENLDSLIQGLNGKSYFRDVILQKKVEKKNSRGTVLQFEISSNLSKEDG